MRSLSTVPTGTILLGDVSDQLRRLPSESIDTVVSSPPYFMLRNYGVNEQIGLEETVHEYIKRMLAVCEDIMRVLTPSGSLWLNIADSYSRHRRYGAPPKSLLLVPERLAIGLSEAGFIVRNSVIWAKPNPMPISVKDRLSCTHERILLVTKSQGAYFDLDAIREPHKTRPRGLTARSRHAKSNRGATKWGDGKPAFAGPLAGSNDGLQRARAEGRAGHPLGKNPGDVWTVATAGFRGPHPAVFPPRLIERPIRATCPERVCTRCQRPWLRTDDQLRADCQCDASWRKGIVLDPFMGAGTTGVVARQFDRDWLGIELNPTYRALALQRIASTPEPVPQAPNPNGGDAP